MEIRIRPATEEDRDLLLEWRNDEEVRLRSFNIDVITKEQHFTWFSKVIASADHILLIGLGPGDEPVGQIRFDIEGGAAIINISIGKEHRGRGLSHKVLEASIRHLKDKGTVSRVVANVKVDNVRSQKMFEACGFRLEREDTVKGSRTKVYFLSV